MSKKDEIIADAGLYSMASIFTQVITLGAGILTRRFLGPVQMGVWSLLQIVLVYASYSTFGASEAIHREIPFYIGKGDEKRADEIKNLVFSFSWVTTALISGGLVLCALILRSRIPQELFFGLLGMAVLVIIQRLSNLLIALVRCYKHFSYHDFING